MGSTKIAPFIGAGDIVKFSNKTDTNWFTPWAG